jgi:hypothetical protein
MNSQKKTRWSLVKLVDGKNRVGCTDRSFLGQWKESVNRHRVSGSAAGRVNLSASAQLRCFLLAMYKAISCALFSVIIR